MRVSRALWLLFSLFIVYGGTIPFHFSGTAGFWNRLTHVPLNPLVAADTGRRLSIPDAVQNVLLFLPFGALGVAAAGPRSRRWRRIITVTLLGFALSMTVELLQLLMANRVASTSDLSMNTVGALIGAVGAGVAIQLSARAWGRLEREGLTSTAELRPLLVASGALAIAFLQPFDITLEVGGIAWKARALEADIWQQTLPRDEGIVLLLASLFAMALAGYLSSLGERNAGRKAAVLGTLLIVFLEASQIFIASRMPGLWDAAVGTMGVGFGAALWATAGRLNWPALWRAVLIAMTACAAAIQMLSPFEWASTYHGFGWVPFLGYYTRTTFDTLSHVIELALAYFPLGYCLTYGATNQRRTLAAVLGVVLVIAGPIEYLQGWVVGRYPDISDIAVSLMGAWAGVRLARTQT